MLTRTMLAVPILTTALLLSGCITGGGGTGGPPPTTAYVSVTMSWASLGAPKCTWPDIGWAATPGALEASGTGPTSAQQATTKAGEGPSSGDKCILTNSFTSLHPGTWTFSTSVGGSATKTVTAGGNAVTLST